MKRFSNIIITTFAIVLIFILGGSGLFFSLINLDEGVTNIRSWIIPIMLLAFAALVTYSAFNTNEVGA